MKKYISNMLRQAKESSFLLSQLNTRSKNNLLMKMAEVLSSEKEYILQENRKDIEAGHRKGLTESFIDRLTLTDERIQKMSCSLKEIIRLPDPINRVLDGWERDNGLSIQKVRVPIGVILMIYEARPNVTSDSIGLMLKSSNVGILRGGSDALNSNRAISEVLKKGVKDSGIKFDPFFVVDRVEREIVDLLLLEKEYIDLVIPRGGEDLIRKVVENSKIPVIKHYKGVCSIFVDERGDMSKALKICVNAKVQRPAVCNAVETILVHRKAAGKFLPRLKKEFDKHRVEIKGDKETRSLLPGIKTAGEEDWSTEYLGLIVSIKVVEDITEAIGHINFYGSHHTDAIVTEDVNRARKFVKEVDSACCFVNISTRFSDGYEFGMGAEIGISTDKLHARGPMGLEELTSYKYIVYGNGQVRE